MIQSVERALRIVELLDESEGGQPLGVLELSRLIGLKQPTVHNFLKTLAHLGYIAQEEETSKYYLTENTRFLGWNGSRKKQIITVAQPIAQRLSDRFNETVLMTTPDRNLRTTLFSITSSRALTVQAETRMDSKFYSSATGRCLLSGMEPEALRKIISLNGLPQDGEWGKVKTRDAIAQELERIRQERYTVYCDRAEGVMAFGSPIKVPEKSINTALGLYMPESRCTDKVKAAILAALMEAGEEIRTALLQSHR